MHIIFSPTSDLHQFFKNSGLFNTPPSPSRLPAYKSPSPSSFLVPGPARLILNAYYKRSIANKEKKKKKHKEEVIGERGAGSFQSPPHEGYSSVPQSLRSYSAEGHRKAQCVVLALPLRGSVAFSKLLNLSELVSPGGGFLQSFSDFLEPECFRGIWLSIGIRFPWDPRRMPGGASIMVRHSDTPFIKKLK